MSIYDEIDLSSVTTLPFARRKNKVRVEDFVDASRLGEGFSIPAGKELTPESSDGILALANAIAAARAGKRTVAFMMGGHVVKTGVSPAVIELMKAGFVTVVSMPGSTAIHDFEIAMWGKTSEPVEEVLGSGSFGMAQEPAALINDTIRKGMERGEGLGESLGRFLVETGAANCGKSLLATACALKIPATVHVTIGADTIHMHPGCDGASLGDTSHRDFRIFAAALRRLGGGVAVNIGSAVVMPEVFLKAVTVLNNQKFDLADMFAANLDRICHYRPLNNVIGRPVSGRGKGIFIKGDHEVLVPLLCHKVLALSRETA